MKIFMLMVTTSQEDAVDCLFMVDVIRPLFGILKGA